MRKKIPVIVCASLLLGSFVLVAQRGAPAQPQPMSFFVTSVGLGKGADLGGLAGADRHCQALAQAAGSTGKTWQAYLSTSAAGGQAAVRHAVFVRAASPRPSSSTASSRMRNFCTFPVTVIGNISTNFHQRGILYVAI